MRKTTPPTTFQKEWMVSQDQKWKILSFFQFLKRGMKYARHHPPLLKFLFSQNSVVLTTGTSPAALEYKKIQHNINTKYIYNTSRNRLAVSTRGFYEEDNVFYCDLQLPYLRLFPATRTFNNESFSVSLGDKTHFLLLFLSIQFLNCFLFHSLQEFIQL